MAEPIFGQTFHCSQGRRMLLPQTVLGLLEHETLAALFAAIDAHGTTQCILRLDQQSGSETSPKLEQS
jgi:hypothetical protein